MNSVKDNSRLIAQLEALLFVCGEPTTVGKIAKIIGEKEEVIKSAADGLRQKLIANDSGLTLIIDGRQLQLVTRPELAPLADKIVKEEFNEELTPAVLETLAMVAYRGPISRLAIEHFRGVNSALTLRRLLIRGLIVKENDLYQISFDFLKQLGITDIGQLPEYDKYKNLKISDNGFG